MLNFVQVQNVGLYLDSRVNEGKLEIRGEVRNNSNLDLRTVHLRILVRDGLVTLATCRVLVHGLRRGQTKLFNNVLEDLSLPAGFQPNFDCQVVEAY